MLRGDRSCAQLLHPHKWAGIYHIVLHVPTGAKPHPRPWWSPPLSIYWQQHVSRQQHLSRSSGQSLWRRQNQCRCLQWQRRGHSGLAQHAAGSAVCRRTGQRSSSRRPQQRAIPQLLACACVCAAQHPAALGGHPAAAAQQAEPQQWCSTTRGSWIDRAALTSAVRKKLRQLLHAADCSCQRFPCPPPGGVHVLRVAPALSWRQ